MAKIKKSVVGAENERFFVSWLLFEEGRSLLDSNKWLKFAEPYKALALNVNNPLDVHGVLLCLYFLCEPKSPTRLRASDDSKRKMSIKMSALHKDYRDKVMKKSWVEFEACVQHYTTYAQAEFLTDIAKKAIRVLSGYIDRLDFSDNGNDENIDLKNSAAVAAAIEKNGIAKAMETLDELHRVYYFEPERNEVADSDANSGGLVEEMVFDSPEYQKRLTEEDLFGGKK